MTMNVEASGDSQMHLTLTDEVLPSLPVYVSRVREFGEQPELEAMFDAIELELRAKEVK